MKKSIITMLLFAMTITINAQTDIPMRAKNVVS